MSWGLDRVSRYEAVTLPRLICADRIGKTLMQMIIIFKLSLAVSRPVRQIAMSNTDTDPRRHK